MRRILVSLLFFLLPLTVQAQQLTVRSGEHEGYSRLVAPLPEEADWEVMHAGRDVTFAISDYDQGYDLSNVFKYISRDRVQSIAALPNGFVIRMGCECRVATFIDQERYVVLDITSPGVKRSIAFTPMMPAAIDSKPPDVTKSRTMELDLPLVPTNRSNPIEPADLPLLARTPLSEIKQESLTEIQNRLSRELGTATTRGLLTPRPGPSLPVVRRAQVDLSFVAPPVREPDIMNTVVNSMRVTSSMDIPDVALKASNPQSLLGLACPTDESLDIANWVDNRPFHQQTGDLRRELYQELDKLDRGAAVKLAKLYIHYGFGAEAQQILRLDTELARSERMLKDIASIMETGIPPPDSILYSLLDCQTDVALWAMLAPSDLDVERTVDPRPALLSLNKLPVHLRSFLAPALSRRLLSHGDAEAAATALRSLERLPSKLPSSARLAQAHIALDEGEIKKATDGLSEVIENNAEQSPEALIALVDARMSAGQPISAETSSLIEAYAKELKQTELGPGLSRAHVLALARSGQFDKAFAASKKLGRDTEEKDTVNLRMRLLEELTTTAEDVIFLEHIFGQSPQDISSLPAQQKVALAARLFDLGFAEQAQNIISEISDRPRDEARQLLAAKIALDLSQPMRAQAELLEMAGAEVDLMRARAKQMAGAHAEAHELYRLANNDEAALRAAWLADDSENINLSENSVFGQILGLSATEVAPSTQTDGMLARSEAALTESRAARQTLLDLLQAPELNLAPTEEIR